MEANGITAVRRKESTGFLKPLAANAVYLLCGVLVASGAALGELAPFGASFTAAAPRKYMAASMLGSALGYIISNPSGGFRYLVVIAAVGGLRWLFEDLKKIGSSRLFAPLAAFLPMLATGFALLFAQTSTLSSFADCAVESLLSGTAAYFMSTAVKLADGRRGIAAYTRQETACVVLTGCVLILAFGSLAYGGVSLGRIIAVLIILLCSKYGGVSGGSVSGIAAGAVFGISDSSLGFICGGYSFGGLMAGLFSPLGKLGCAAAFTVSSAIMSLAFGDMTSISSVLVEGIIGGTVFMLLPKEIGNIISPAFSSDRNCPVGEILRRSLIMRLDFAAKAIRSVRNDVDRVSEKLGGLYAPTFDGVCRCVAEEVCSGCGLRVYCYEHEEGVTRDDFRRLEEILREKSAINGDDVRKAFVKKCCKSGEIAYSMNENYRNYLSGLEAQRRVSEVRGAVAEQFSGISGILGDLSAEFGGKMRCEPRAADRITEELSRLGADVAECVCFIGEGGGMRAEIVLGGDLGEKLSKSRIAGAVSKCCGRRFDLPTVDYEGGRIRMAMCEMPVYDVEIGTGQHIAGGGTLCGDCIDYFNDGFGHTYALVCDGMGTGGRAAVDGNMAASVMGRMIRTGLSADSSLQIVNSALMIKSEDESLSTLDVTSVDLYTGKTVMRKAGAPMTFIKKNGRVSVHEMPSMPAGILNSIKFSSDTVKLSSGDMILMISDGVVTGDEKWLEKLVKSWNEGSCRELASVVVEEAVRRRGGEREDDVTAVAMRITEN